MLLMDIVLIGAITVFVLAWWSRRLPQRGAILLAAASVAVVVGSLSIMDDRWQAATGLIVGILLLLVLLIIRLRGNAPKRNIPYISGTLFALLGALVFLSIYLFPVNDLPTPSGKYKVGVRDFELVDESRRGIFAAAEDEPRRLLIRAWYPAGRVEGFQPQPYFKSIEVDTTAAALGNNLIQAPFFFKYLKHAYTNSYRNAPLIDGAKHLPVVFYSPGYSSFVGQNTALMEELASNGYAVYAVSHPYDSADVVFPDGTVIKTDEHLREDKDETLKAWKDDSFINAYFGVTIDDRYAGQLETHEKAVARNDRFTVRSAEIWLADRLFVHDALASGEVPEEIEELVAASDLSNTGEMGMSFGGSTTGAVCMVDPRCAAGVNLDGGDFHFTPFGKNMPVPFLMFSSDFVVSAAMFAKMLGIENTVQEHRSGNRFSFERPETAGLRDDIYRLMVKDATHLGFSDLPHFVRRPVRDKLFGATNADEMLRVQNDFVLGFFDKHLRGLKNGFPVRQLTDHKDMVSRDDVSDIREWWLKKHPEDRSVQAITETEPADARTNSLTPDLALMVPMRDGVRLATYICLPKGEGPFPTVLVRSIYRDSLIAFNHSHHENYLASGYAVVWQSTRGSGYSEGVYRFRADDRNDGYDSVEWVAAQPWSNGMVAMDGGSYLGMTQLAAAATAPPHLKAIIPHVPSARFFHELPYFGGIFMRLHTLNWHELISVDAWSDLSGGFMDANAVLADPVWKERLNHRPAIDAANGFLEGDRLAQYRGFLEHPVHDEYWAEIEDGPGEYANMDVAVLMVTGNFDLNVGAMGAWQSLEKHAPNPAQRHMLIGPWTHAQSRPATAESNGPFNFDGLGTVDIASLKIAFLDKYLKGKAPSVPLPDRVHLFVTGANEWREVSNIPVPTRIDTKLFLASGGSANSASGDGALSFELSSGTADSMVSDPENPITINGVLSKEVADYQQVELRHDVLVYTSPPLDKALTIIGEPSVTLQISADTLDADVIVRLTDVYPGGRSIALGYGGALRLRYRNGFDKQTNLVPGEVYEISFPLTYIGHQIPAGHRLRLDILGTEFPLLDPNPNTGNAIATATEMQKTTVTVHHDVERTAFIELPVVDSHVH